MGIFELLGELINPGPVGNIDFQDEDHKLRKKLVVIRFVLAVLILLGVEYLIIFTMNPFNSYLQLLKLHAIFLTYLLLAYRLRVNPDYDNLGWVPFLINNPFRISDNINRFLVLLNVLFLPGKFVAHSVVGFFRVMKRRN